MAASATGASLVDLVRQRARIFFVVAVVITLCFSPLLYQLLKLAWNTEIQSHILLIPFISAYLWKVRRSQRAAGSQPAEKSGTSSRWGETPSSRDSFPSPETTAVPLESRQKVDLAPSGALSPDPRSLLFASLAALCGFAALAAYFIWGKSGHISHNDALSLSTFSFLAFLLSAAFGTLGGGVMRPYTFVIAFLWFMIPLPLALVDFMSVGLQRASAEAADWMITSTGMPFFRDGMRFQFAGRAILVAEECSGVRSTFVLFITSLLAGHLFLRTGWKKALLALAIFPLGILRNGFRVTAISWLTVNVNPNIIDGPLHHHGGPLFFALSLIPLFALMWFLRRSENRPSPHAMGRRWPKGG